MRNVYWAMLAGMMAAIGCKSTPNREMRPPVTEEFNLPPEKYAAPPDLPRETPLLTPKSGSTGPLGPQGLPTPGFGPGNAQGGGAGARR